MTIRRGEPWGETVDRPDDLTLAAGDVELAGLVASGHHGPLGLSGGDLHAALGAPGRRDPVQRLPVDVVHVVADGRRLCAVAHVLARRSWWRGPIVAVMNVDRMGAWRVAPRAHPNDGRLDVVEVASTMGLRQRWQARRRLATGDHLPHPDISVRAASSAEWHFESPCRLYVDGEPEGDVRSLAVAVEPDAVTIHV